MPTLAYIQAKYQTVGAILNGVAAELGIASPVSDPVLSTNPIFIQLVALANQTGQDLLQKHDWQTLQVPYTFTSVAGPGGATFQFYTLPADFYKMIEQTGWNRTSRLPLAGPMTPQITELFVGWVSNQFTIYLGFRQWEDDFMVFPSPNPSGMTIAFEYISRFWLLGTGQTSPTLGPPANYWGLIVNSSDVVRYEPVMFSRALKLRWLTEKGFDTTAANADWEQAFNNIKAADEGAQVLNMARSPLGMRYLDSITNVPPSGFGQ
jgi:hypothetical protein